MSKKSKELAKKQSPSIQPSITKKSGKEDKPAKKHELKRSDSQSSSGGGDGLKGIRFNVCKSIKDALFLRFKECPDIDMDNEKVESLAVSIEEELNSLYKEPAKYKNKFRSLAFNIKDPKNQTLFRKIADGSITPDQVVRLTSEEMASQELAQWREREARHQLEMIKKNELELLQQAKTVVMKTHKGELVIENEDAIGSKNPEAVVSELESALNNDDIDVTLLSSVKEKEITYPKIEKIPLIIEKHKHGKRKRNRKHSVHDKSHKKHRSRSRNRKSSEKEKKPITPGKENKSKKEIKEEEEVKFEADQKEPIKEDVELKTDDAVTNAIMEVESDLSDREPSSTVNIKTPPYEEEEETDGSGIWQGTLMMTDVAKFKTTIQEVSGNCSDLSADLPTTVDCVGRINPDTVWDYISKMKKSGTKEILVIKFVADNEEDKMSYLSLYSYLSSRNRMGVVGNASKMIKDFYVLPLASHNPVPQVLLPLDGPGFEDYRPHLLLGIIVRTRRKRVTTDRNLPFIPKVPKKTPRSYTPPIPGEESYTPPKPPPTEDSFTPPLSPKLNAEIRSRRVKESSNSTMSDAYDAEDNDAPYSPIDEDTPYSPGDGEEEEIVPNESTVDMECSAELQRKMDELNRRIEEQKKQIVTMSSAIGIEPSEHDLATTQEDEAYSPSRSFTPPPVTENIPFLSNQPLPDIALPSNLQEILASIKKQHVEPTKGLDLKLDPIVQAYSKVDEPYSPGDKPENETGDSSSDNVTTPMTPESNVPIVSSLPKESTIVSRDPRQRSDSKRISSLSQLSDEELIKKAAEMGFMNPENPKPIPDTNKRRLAPEQPPPPGLEDEYNFAPIVDSSPSNVTSFSGPSYPASQTFNRYTPSGPPLPPTLPPPLPLPPTMNPYTGNYLPPVQGPPMYQQSMPPHIPYTNPQPPPPVYPPPQPPPPQLPPPEPIKKPPPPKERSVSPPLNKKENTTRKSKKIEKTRSETLRSTEISKSHFENKRLSDAKRSPEPSVSRTRSDKRKYSEVSSKDYELERSSKKRERFIRKRDKREERKYEKIPEKRRESWEYEPPSLPVPPSSSLQLPPPPRGVMRGRFHQQRGRFPIRRGFDRPGRGFHRGFHPPRGHLAGPLRGLPPGPSRGHLPGPLRGHPTGPLRGHPPDPLRGHPPGPSRGFHSKRMEPRSEIQNEWDNEIRQFEENQRHREKKFKKIEKEKRWRSSVSPIRKRRSKDSDSES
uniref:TFIIS central domain-containing protein n=2 Tax=Clastoptera arizonana TaxID=38151 RepID=A0A1B6DTH9_9HEMI